ncbi:acetate/propionate family kinase [Kineosporia sp. A_224]|uniref:acetate/propionate family kinase n=1 Tax=Kineosporia sp. A_224 TaxID=1962180 RepID=UPI000B4B39A6|nr:acetate kinase [Kineosporia sp. A_224]
MSAHPGTGDGGGRVLVVNTGSSSLKYRLVEPGSGTVLARGLVERIGETGGRLEHRRPPAHDGPDDVHEVDGPFPDHAAALAAVRDAFADHGPDLADAGLAAVGHRVVHGGDRFRDPVLVDDDVLKAIDDLAVLAPLHNPANATGIRVARDLLPDLPHVAVFDTAFHATIPPRAATYAVPAEWRTEHDVRKYGFHGTSYAYVSREAARLLGRAPEETNLVVLHLGNGASACAVENGRSIDTSMGLTPLAGLVMGTRSGDVDPALVAHLHRVAGLSTQDVDDALNKRSGLLGLAGVSDVREVTERAAAGDPDAVLALDVYCYRIRTYVGAYTAALGRVDAVVFTAGVGENSAVVRERSLAGLERLGVVVDEARNRAGGRWARAVSPDGAEVPVLVVPTDEEREIARQALVVARG